MGCTSFMNFERGGGRVGFNFRGYGSAFSRVYPLTWPWFGSAALGKDIYKVILASCNVSHIQHCFNSEVHALY